MTLPNATATATASRLRREEEGFTLVELLVVVLLIGILTAIALAAYSGQGAKSQDAEAKANARSLVTHVEACHTETRDYRDCEPVDPAFPTSTGLRVGTADGEVGLRATGQDTYTITGYSRSGTDFTIAKTAGGELDRGCTRAGTGGCKDGRSW